MLNAFCEIVKVFKSKRPLDKASDVSLPKKDKCLESLILLGSKHKDEFEVECLIRRAKDTVL